MREPARMALSGQPSGARASGVLRLRQGDRQQQSVLGPSPGIGGVERFAGRVAVGASTPTPDGDCGDLQAHGNVRIGRALTERGVEPQRPCNGLSRSLASLLGLLLIARERGPNRRDRRVAQSCRVVAARRTSQRLLDGRERVGDTRQRRCSSLCGGLNGATSRGSNIPDRARNSAICPSKEAPYR